MIELPTLCQLIVFNVDKYTVTLILWVLTLTFDMCHLGFTVSFLTTFSQDVFLRASHSLVFRGELLGTWRIIPLKKPSMAISHTRSLDNNVHHEV